MGGKQRLGLQCTVRPGSAVMSRRSEVSGVVCPPNHGRREWYLALCTGKTQATFARVFHRPARPRAGRTTSRVLLLVDAGVPWMESIHVIILHPRPNPCVSAVSVSN